MKREAPTQEARTGSQCCSACHCLPGPQSSSRGPVDQQSLQRLKKCTRLCSRRGVAYCPTLSMAQRIFCRSTAIDTWSSCCPCWACMRSKCCAFIARLSQTTIPTWQCNVRCRTWRCRHASLSRSSRSTLCCHPTAIRCDGSPDLPPQRVRSCPRASSGAWTRKRVSLDTVRSSGRAAPAAVAVRRPSARLVLSVAHALRATRTLATFVPVCLGARSSSSNSPTRLHLPMRQRCKGLVTIPSSTWRA